MCLAKEAAAWDMHEYIPRSIAERHLSTKANPEPFRTEVEGIPLHIEHPRGSIKLHGKDGKAPIASKFNGVHYGEFAGYKGIDGDRLDVLIGPDADHPLVTVVNKGRGKQLEDKIFLHVRDAEKAANKMYKEVHDVRTFPSFAAFRSEYLDKQVNTGAPEELSKLPYRSLTDTVGAARNPVKLALPKAAPEVPVQAPSTKGGVHPLATAAAVAALGGMAIYGGKKLYDWHKERQRKQEAGELPKSEHSFGWLS